MHLMKILRILAMLVLVLTINKAIIAQCSICTKTASQLGEGPAQALNSAIIYLAFAPLAIMGFIGYRWWKKEKQIIEEEANISSSPTATNNDSL